MSSQLPGPRLTKVYRLEASLGEPLDLGETAHGHRRIVPLSGGTFDGAQMSGKLLPGAARGGEVDANEYTFRASTQIETAGADLGWLNKGEFISVGGRQPGGVIYETYLVE